MAQPGLGFGTTGDPATGEWWPGAEQMAGAMIVEGTGAESEPEIAGARSQGSSEAPADMAIDLPRLLSAWGACRRILGDDHLNTLRRIISTGPLLQQQGSLAEPDAGHDVQAAEWRGELEDLPGPKRVEPDSTCPAQPAWPIRNPRMKERQPCCFHTDILRAVSASRPESRGAETHATRR
jgi:hypothetical protein